MSTDAQSGTGQAPTPDATQPQPQGQAPTDASTPQSQAQQTPSATDAPERTVEQLKAMLAEARKEAAAHRVKAKELDKLREEAETAKLSEQEKLAKRAEAAEAKNARYQQLLAGAHVERTAQQLGIIDPEVAHTLIAAKLEYDEDGLPSNAEALLKALIASKPYLAAVAPTTPTTPAAPAPRTPQAGAAMNPPRSAQPAHTFDPKNPPRLGDPGLWNRQR